MAQAKPVYDLTLLLDADAPSERRAEILREVEAAIGGGGGEIVSDHDWGVRTLAYEIAHHKEAEYHLIQLTAPTELLDRLRNTLRVADGVLRHRFIRLPAGMPPPPAMRSETRPAAGASVAAAPPAGAAPATESPGDAGPVEAPAPAQAAPAPSAPAGEPEAPAAPAPESSEAPPES